MHWWLTQNDELKTYYSQRSKCTAHLAGGCLKRCCHAEGSVSSARTSLFCSSDLALPLPFPAARASPPNTKDFVEDPFAFPLPLPDSSPGNALRVHRTSVTFFLRRMLTALEEWWTDDCLWVYESMSLWLIHRFIGSKFKMKCSEMFNMIQSQMSNIIFNIQYWFKC